jgi:hypothetical protein
MVLRALGWGLVGLIVAPVAMFGIMAIVYHFSPECGTPGDSGGCEMGMAVAIILAVPIGALAGFLIALAVSPPGRQAPPPR